MDRFIYATTLVLGWSVPVLAAEPETPEGVFLRTCASCHGTDGRGTPLHLRGFEIDPPDFTDCSFASREADSDWFAVVHEGGPVRGFSHRMPAFGQALGEEQIRKALEHVRTFCPERGWPAGNLNRPRPMFTEKAFVEDEVVLTLGAGVQAPHAFSGKLVFEKRFGKRSQFEAVVPFGAKERRSDDPRGSGWNGGLGDVAVGIKHVLVALSESGTLVSGLIEWILPTGRPDQGMGSGLFLLEPAILVGQALGPVGFVHVQAGVKVPLEREGSSEAFWRMAYGRPLSQGGFGRLWTPMIEVLGFVDLESGAPVHWDVAPQLQWTLSTRQHVTMCLATRIPVEPGNARSVGIWTYLLWEWFDGGLMEGW